MTNRVMIESKEHLEQIFRKYAELKGVEFDDEFFIEENRELTFGELKENAERIGYENLSISKDIIENLENGRLNDGDVFLITCWALAVLFVGVDNEKRYN